MSTGPVITLDPDAIAARLRARQVADAQAGIALSAARRTSAIAEDELLAGYGAVSRAAPIRTEECACGGLVAATEGDWHDIAQTQASHVASAMHQAWRRGQ